MTKHSIEYLTGPMHWVEPKHDHSAQIRGGTLQNKDTIVITVFCDGTYSIEMKRQAGNHFSGKWSYRQNGKVIDGHAEGRLYEGDGSYLFFGKWHEDNTEHYWWTELFATDPPEDDE